MSDTTEYLPVRDMKLAVTLIALKHLVHDIKIDGRTVYVVFEAEDVASDESAFYLRALDPVPIENMLSALQRFRILLMREQGDEYLVSSREAAISLMSAGIRPSGLQQLERMLYFKFPKTIEVKNFLLFLANGTGPVVAVDDFWSEYQHFSDALRSR